MAKKLIGDPIDRIDGTQKVTGSARYSADVKRPGLVHGVLVMSTVANGTIQTLDTTETLRLPGILAVMSHTNAPKLGGMDKNKSGETASDRVLHVFQDNLVHYNNQPIAMVIADTFEQAVEGASLVRVTYATEPVKPGLPTSTDKPLTPPRLPRVDDQVDTTRGDVKKGMAGAASTLEATYKTPTQFHNALEPHAVLSFWEGDKLTMYTTTQGISGYQKRVAELFGMPKENVRVITQYLGGGFGSKGTTFSQAMLGPMAAKLVGKPVKLVLKREHMFGMVGSRSATVQTMNVGATADGQLTAMTHDTLAQTSAFDEFMEPAGTITRMLYACPNLATTHKFIKANVGSTSPMRAPGEAPGVFALECAIDEMADKLKIDPLQFRLKNYAEEDPHRNRPFSSKSLRECYQQGADQFGWSKRAKQPRATRDGNYLVGMGMATTVYPVNRGESTAMVRLNTDGTVRLETGTQDLGTGTFTIMNQLAAEVLGLSPDQVTLGAGDSKYPEAVGSGGSRTTVTTGSAVTQAAQEVLKKAKKMAYSDKKSPLYAVAEAEIEAKNGRLESKSDPKKGESFTSLLKRNGNKPIEATTLSKSGAEKETHSMSAFGAIFVEVRVDEALGEVRISRMLGNIAAGKIVNAKTAKSQILGGMVWGVSMALHEYAALDTRNARIMNPNLAEYHVPVNADIRDIDAIFIDEADETVNPAGVKGIGEIGIVGTVSAIANAIYHATGKRHYDLPITVEKLIG
ncbi:xanthine dehydrogenase family protein molybdopterin-binding subunit [Fibrella forsythiae]|uniref:Xanthine dehydrogenase family protein molybdopterin-binding subunit n=1 Tax=Fibrella forsythiae TaxID=2817061 RepID=A0ABS3JD73_9BACT|nr:xanthine dehydrogenase family protein molybdopterin-binding subunit [Fibrella forsythiae]MBO0947948.1 xanthine dehydrogenase family protein molybdopterin-binding subunit [Fibrella forsythiae]